MQPDRLECSRLRTNDAAGGHDVLELEPLLPRGSKADALDHDPTPNREGDPGQDDDQAPNQEYCRLLASNCHPSIPKGQLEMLK